MAVARRSVRPAVVLSENPPVPGGWHHGVSQRFGADDDRLRIVRLFGVAACAQRIVVVQEEQPSTSQRQDALDSLGWERVGSPEADVTLTTIDTSGERQQEDYAERRAPGKRRL